MYTTQLLLCIKFFIRAPPLLKWFTVSAPGETFASCCFLVLSLPVVLYSFFDDPDRKTLSLYSLCCTPRKTNRRCVWHRDRSANGGCVKINNLKSSSQVHHVRPMLITRDGCIRPQVIIVLLWRIYRTGHVIFGRSMCLPRRAENSSGAYNIFYRRRRRLCIGNPTCLGRLLSRINGGEGHVVK